LNYAVPILLWAWLNYFLHFYLQASTTATAPTSPPPSGNRTTFPEALKKYVARTFEDVLPEEKKDVEAELKRIITDAFNEKVVWTVHWDDMPLPQVIIARRRAQQTRATSSPSESPDGTTIATNRFGKFNLEDRKRKKCVSHPPFFFDAHQLTNRPHVLIASIVRMAPRRPNSRAKWRSACACRTR